MKEIPILYQTDMVQACLASTKTQTRRTSGLDKFNINPDAFTCNGKRIETCRFWDESKEADPNPIEVHYVLNSVDGFENKVKCPYGKPGDLLWVRETWAKIGDIYLYKANAEHQAMNWKPSIHMPKAASRIWLLNESVRLERLQDITREDCIAEGIAHRLTDFQKWYRQPGDWYDYERKTFAPLQSGKISPSMSFMSLWRSINGKESWKANPWVWVVKSRVVSTTGREDVRI